MAMGDDKSEVDKTAVAESDTLKIRLEEAKSAPPLLVVISGRPLGKNFLLNKQKMILGRDLAADISIGETSISRKNTEFQITADGILCKDLGSTNGTFVNDEKITTKKLEDGDLIRCGNTILKFLREGNIESVHHVKLYENSSTDGLTGALNKKQITDLIEEEFQRSLTKSLPFSLLMLDLDHFKKVNDTHGHPAGDHVLKSTATLIKDKMTRGQDALGRYGGEEFALVLRETPLRIAVDIAERIRVAVEKSAYQFEDKTIPVTLSIGVASLDSTTKNYEDLIATADKALYDAKNQGRNRVCAR